MVSHRKLDFSANQLAIAREKAVSFVASELACCSHVVRDVCLIDCAPAGLRCRECRPYRKGFRRGPGIAPFQRCANVHWRGLALASSSTFVSRMEQKSFAKLPPMATKRPRPSSTTSNLQTLPPRRCLHHHRLLRRRRRFRSRVANTIGWVSTVERPHFYSFLSRLHRFFSHHKASSLFCASIPNQ
jgi:hypothetical protein